MAYLNPAAGATRASAGASELSTLAAAIPQTALTDLGATTGLANNTDVATLVALKTELDATNTKLNALLAKLRTAGIIAT